MSDQENDKGGVNIGGGRVSVGGNLAGGDQIRAGNDVVGGNKTTAGGDIVGRDKVTFGASAQDLAQYFAEIYRQIEARPRDPNVDKAEVKDTVEKIEQEARKGEQANANKVERWLKFLASMADDIFQVTAATLANPLAGAAKVIQLVAQKAKEENPGGG